MARHEAAYDELWRSVRGADVAEAERLLHEYARTFAPYLPEVDRVFSARVMSDPRWARKHPLAAIALAWKYRDVRPLRRSLRLLWRPPASAG